MQVDSGKSDDLEARKVETESESQSKKSADVNSREVSQHSGSEVELTEYSRRL